MTDPRLTVLVVWMPVMPTDVAPPTSGTMARLSDPRVRAFWDKEHVVSRALLALARSDKTWLDADDAERLASEGAVVWDSALVFDPGGSWSPTPRPRFYGYTVVDSTDRLLAALAVKRVFSTSPRRGPAGPPR